MPSSDVRWPVPLTRLNPWYPGMMGVPGTDNETGLRDHCTGAVFYVDPNFPGANDNRDGTNPTNPLATVAKAITLCQPHRGDVIVVMDNSSWTYAQGGQGIATAQYTTTLSEEVTLDVAGVRLVGLAAGGLGVPWYPIQNGGTCITVHGVNVTIEGFVFEEGPTYTGLNAIYAEWDGATMFADNLCVRNCYFYDSVVNAIELEHIYSADIHHNVFSTCAYGIYADPLGSGLYLTSIHHNSFFDCSIGAMTLGDAVSSHIYNNRIYNADAENGAACPDEGIDTTAGSNNMVCDNYFSCVLPGPGNGDWNDLNTATATDAWVQNFCLNGPNVTNPT